MAKIRSQCSGSIHATSELLAVACTFGLCRNGQELDVIVFVLEMADHLFIHAGGLSGGAIAGIIIAVLAAAAILALALLVAFKRRRIPAGEEPNNGNAGTRCSLFLAPSLTRPSQAAPGLCSRSFPLCMLLMLLRFAQ